jgi:hypothetical protein
MKEINELTQFFRDDGQGGVFIRPCRFRPARNPGCCIGDFIYVNSL